MITLADVEALNALARDLARRSFGGEGSVGRQGNGVVRLTIVKHDHNNSVGLYRERDMAAATFEDASREIATEIESAANPFTHD
jgi:hypothetical protein